MDRIKRVFNRGSKRVQAPQVQCAQPQAKALTPAEMDKFAKAVVREYGETLVLLGKE